MQLGIHYFDFVFLTCLTLGFYSCVRAQAL